MASSAVPVPIADALPPPRRMLKSRMQEAVLNPPRIPTSTLFPGMCLRTKSFTMECRDNNVSNKEAGSKREPCMIHFV